MPSKRHSDSDAKLGINSPLSTNCEVCVLPKWVLSQTNRVRTDEIGPMSPPELLDQNHFMFLQALESCFGVLWHHQMLGILWLSLHESIGDL